MKKKVLSLLLFISLLVLPISLVKAQDSYFYAGENVSLSEEEYNHSVFSAGDNVKNSAKVNGALFTAGNVVNVTGQVDYGFVGGQTLNIDGVVERDLFAAGGSIVLGKDSVLKRDIYVAGSSVDVKTNITGNAFIAGSIVTLDNITIDGNLRVAANQINVVGNVEIKGTLYIDESTIINDENNLKYGNKEVSSVTSKEFKTNISDAILGILTSIFSSIILALIFPKLFKKLSYDLTVKDVFKKLFIGLCVLVVIPILSLILFITAVGASIGTILLLLYLIGFMIATILTSYVVGYNLYNEVFKQKDNIYVDLIIGIFVIKVLEIIPVVGPFVGFVAFIYGLGLLYKLVLNENK